MPVSGSSTKGKPRLAELTTGRFGTWETGQHKQRGLITRIGGGTKVDILGSVVLSNEGGEPYKAPGALAGPKTFGSGVLGAVILIDPETGEPYSLES